MRHFILTLFILLLVAGCVPASPEPEAPAAVATIAVERPTEAAPTPFPPPTVTPTPALPPTPTPDIAAFTPTPIPTPTAVPTIGSPIPENLSLTFAIADQLGGSARAVFATADRIYLGMGSRLLVLDTDLNLLGESDPFDNLILDIAVQDGVAYLALGSSGMTAVSVSDPASLTPLGSLDIAYSQRTYIDTVVAQSARVILRNNANGQTSLIQADITNPAEPVQRLIMAAPSYANLTVTDTAVYATASEIVQILDPNELTDTLGTITFAEGTFAMNIAVRDNLAYVLQIGQGAGVVIYDVSNPRQPQPLTDLLPVGGFAVSGTALTANGLISYGSMGEFGFCGTSFSGIILDDALQPERIDGWDEPNCVYDTAVSPDGTLLYSAGQQGLRVYDVSDLTNPTETAHFQNPFHMTELAAADSSHVYAITATGQEYRLATANRSGSDLSFNDLAPVTLPEASIASLLLQDNTLIAGRWAVGSFALDTRTQPPTLLPEQSLENGLAGDRYANIIGDGVLFAPLLHRDYFGAVAAFDISDPANATRIGVLDLGQTTVYSLAYVDGLLYAISEGEAVTLHVIDASDPTNLILLGELTLPSSAHRLAVVDDIVFAACPWECTDLYVVDTAVSSAPNLIATYNLPYGASSLTVDAANQLLFTTSFRDDSLAVDISDLMQPVIVGRIAFTGQITLLDEGLLIAADDAGLITVQLVR